jgi:hypothetical protein
MKAGFPESVASRASQRPKDYIGLKMEFMFKKLFGHLSQNGFGAWHAPKYVGEW